MTPEDGSSDGEPSPRLPDEDRSVPDSRGGVEVAKAIEALGRALGRVSLSGQQGEACFTIEPAELTLQVAVSGAGPAGIEWLVLGPGDDEPPHASAMQMLKIRLAPLLGTEGHASAEVEQVLPDVAEEVSTAGSSTFNWDYATLDADKLDKVLGSAAQPQSVEFVRLRIYEFPAQFSQHDTAVLSGRSRPVMQLAVERDSFTLPTRSKIAEAIRDKGAETMAQYIANRLDTMVSRQLSRWRTEDPGGFATGADWVEKFQASLHQYLVGAPIKELASAAGIPDASALGFVAEQIPIGIIDKDLDRAKLLIEISGIVVGAATGVPVLACASSKALAHDLFRRTVAAGIKEFIIRQPVPRVGPVIPAPWPGESSVERQPIPHPLPSPVKVVLETHAGGWRPSGLPIPESAELGEPGGARRPAQSPAAAAAQREAARQEAARQEAARQEAARQEAARQEAARQEAARQEAARQDPGQFGF
jgi:hypothetical protein